MSEHEAKQAEPITELQRLQAEIDILTKSGIIEVAVRNPSVMEYMKHWEGRALKAEAALTAALAVEQDKSTAEPVSAKIERYYIDTLEMEMVKRVDGEWVSYDDHVAILAALSHVQAPAALVAAPSREDVVRETAHWFAKSCTAAADGYEAGVNDCIAKIETTHMGFHPNEIKTINSCVAALRSLIEEGK